MVRWIFCLALAGLASVGLAPVGLASRVRAAGPQTAPTVNTLLSAGVVKLGGTVNLHVVVENAEDARVLGLPEVQGLSIGPLGAPASEIVQTIRGGRRTVQRTLRWAIPVRPLEVGEYELPSMTLSIDGREVSTRGDLVLKVVADLRGDELGFFEIEDPPARIYEGQPFTINLLFGWDRALDVSTAQLRMPWWGNLPGTIEAKGDVRNMGGRWLDLPLNGRQRIAVEELSPRARGGSQFRCLQLKRRFLATRPGKLELPTSVFEFGRVVRRARDFFGRDEIEEFYALLPGFTIEVLPVPEEGRPFDWTGAVGTIRAERRVDRRDVDVGESVKLTVTWTGDANLEFFEPPDVSRLDRFSGFRLLGTEEQNLNEERRVTYDLVPMSEELSEVPGVPLWTFDPQLEDFVQVETEPVPIRVRALEGMGGLEDLDAERRGTPLDIRDIDAATRAPARLPRLGGTRLVGGAGAIFALWLAGRTAVRRRGDPDSAEARRKRAARRRLGRELARAAGARGQTEALGRYLAARTGEGEQAWIGRDALAWARDSEHGLDADSARELRGLLGELDARAWAGDDAKLDPKRVLALVDRLQEEGL